MARISGRVRVLALVLLLLGFTANGTALADTGKPGAAKVNAAAPPTTRAQCPGARAFERPESVDVEDIAALSPNDVWAVGYVTEIPNFGDPESVAAIAHWDGQSWSYTPGIWNDRPHTFSGLNAVSAISPTDIWAVGYQQVFARGPLVTHYDGNAWHSEQIPNNSDAINVNDVLALPGDEVWLVGFDDHRGLPLIEHRSGGTWQRVSGADVGPGISWIEAVAGVTANDIWLAGYHYIADGSVIPLVEHWDGQTWTGMALPGAEPNEKLNGVAVRAADDAWLVGGNYLSDESLSSWHWDGSAWTAVPIEQHGAQTVLLDVAYHGPQDVWAVGNYKIGGQLTGLTEHWDGHSWITVASTANLLNNLSILPSVFWAAGDQLGMQPLVPFTDIGGDSFESYIDRLACANVVDGFADNTFQPYQNATRADVARWVVKLRGWSLATPVQATFLDVPPGSPDYPYIETALAHGVLNGYTVPTGREFRPNGSATRGQMSKMIVNAFGWTPASGGSPHFGDVDANNPFYSQIETIYNRGLVSCYDDMTFRWGNNLTRGQLSKVLYLAQGN